MSHYLPNRKTVYHYFRKWKLDGIWDKIMTVLRKQVRVEMGREEEPSAAIIDQNQSGARRRAWLRRRKKSLGAQTASAR